MANLVLTSVTPSCFLGKGRVAVRVDTIYTGVVRVYLRGLPYVPSDEETPPEGGGLAVELQQDIIGSGTVLFTELPDGPYFAKATFLQNGDTTAEKSTEISCAYTPPPGPTCTIGIASVAVTATEVQIGVSGAQGVTEYSLDAFATVQESGVFPKPAPGVYFAYARDKANPACVSSFLFAVKRSYGLLYTHSFGSLFAGQVTLNIYEKDYTGEAVQLGMIGGEGVVISMKGTDDDRFKGVKPTECKITLLAKENFEFFRLYTSTDRKHRVEVTSSTKGMLFAGFLLPFFYEQPYLSGTQSIKLTATDGLEDLKNVDFKPRSSAMFPTFITTLEAVRFCLCQLELDLTLSLGVNYFSSEMDKSLEPFTQSQINNRFPIDGKKSINCLDALERILQPYSARLFQMGGEWHVQVVTEMGKEFVRRRFSLDGQYLDSGPYQSSVTVKTPGTGFPIFIQNSQYLNVLPVYRERKVQFSYGENFNFVAYGDFPEGSMTPAQPPTGWLLRAFTGKVGNPGKENLLLFPTRMDSLPAEPYIESPAVYFTPNPNVSSTTPIRVSIRFKAPLPDVGNTPQPLLGYYTLLYSLKVGDVYATTNQGWSSTEQFIFYGAESGFVNQFVTFERYYNNPPAAGNMTLRLYVARPTDNPALAEQATIEYEFVKVEYGDFNPFYTDFEEEELTGTNSEDISLKAEPITLHLGDTKPGMYSNAIYVGEKSTTSWESPEGDTETLQVHYMRNLLKFSARPYLKLSCDLKGDVPFDAVVRDTVMPDKSFLPVSMTWDVVSGTYQCQYYEQEDTGTVNDGEPTSGFLLEGSGFLLMESGDYLLKEI